MASGEKGQSLRSNYGLKTYTPEEMKNQWKQHVEKHRLMRVAHKSANEERQKIAKIKEGFREEISYFNNNKQHFPVSAYDRQFHVEQGYQSKLARDDRKHHVLDPNFNSEESNKTVPILSSSAYGHRQPLEKLANIVELLCETSTVTLVRTSNQTFKDL